jgi:hypothetical protein
LRPQPPLPHLEDPAASFPGDFAKKRQEAEKRRPRLGRRRDVVHSFPGGAAWRRTMSTARPGGGPRRVAEEVHGCCGGGPWRAGGLDLPQSRAGPAPRGSSGVQPKPPFSAPLSSPPSVLFSCSSSRLRSGVPRLHEGMRAPCWINFSFAAHMASLSCVHSSNLHMQMW